MNALSNRMLNAGSAAAEQSAEQNLPIGRMLQILRGLSDAQIDEIVAYQRRHGMQFGEAAVALQLASDDEIVSLISKQFHYPYDAASDASRLPAELVVAKNPFSEGAELIRDLRTQLTMGVMSPAQGGRLLAVCSAESGDGKSFVAANLAASFSQLGARTLLIDANMRQPRIGPLFGAAQESIGLSMILSGRAVQYAFLHVPALPNLLVLPAGTIPPNPQELLQGPAFELLLDELRQKFDHIVIDTPSSNAGADFRMVAARADATLVVARQDVTPFRSLDGLLKTLTRGRGTLAGVILNRY
jgi:chain length determinant protein tyrosine kinase EpsG